MKKRITGAIVLVALVVIFVPMLLDDDAPKVELGPLIPEQPNDRFEETLIPPQDVTQVGSADTGDQQRYALPVGEVMDSMTETAVAEKTTESVEIIDETTSVVVEQKAPVTNSQITGQGWVIQAGSFGQSDNADKLVARINASGRSAFIEPIDIKGKTLYRVRVGPIQSRAAADQELSAIEKEFQLKGKVLAFP